MSVPNISGDRPIKADTPLGGTVLVPVALTGEEELSRPFLFTVEFVSARESVGAVDVLGKPITLHLPLADGGERLVHGLVRRFVNLGKQHELTRYRAEIVPALWFLTLSGDYRTFEEQSAPDIVQKVCKAGGVTDVKVKLFSPATRPAIPYVAQYGESDFDFVSRLLEDAGLYYRFEHTSSAHTLVITDAFGGVVPAQAKALTVRDATSGDDHLPNTAFGVTHELAVHTKEVLVADHDLSRADDKASAPSKVAGARGTRFDFLGDLGPHDASDRAKRLIEADEGMHDVVRGQSNTPAMQAGTQVKLTNGPFAAGQDQFHVLRVRHSAKIGDVHAGGELAATYENEFTAVPVKTRYRPPRLTPRPTARGAQTAVVVGSGSAGDVDVDAEGRVLLKFPWDRGAGKDGKSKHRVHVASAWAGTGWGVVQLPRLGQEVLVDFMDGDPSRPIVTGRVYNSTHKPPYALPANKTQSGVKSRTVGGGDANFNEIRFEDKKGEEHVHVQAEKDLQAVVKNDETRTVGRDSTTTVKRNRTVTVSEGDEKLDVKKGTRTVTVKGDDTLKVSTGNLTVKVASGGVSITADTKDVAIKAGAGKVLIDGMQKIELKLGANSIKIDPSGITLSGTVIKLNATGQLELSGAVVKVQGQGMLQLKGAMTQVNGDGLLMAKGGLTMIN